MFQGGHPLEFTGYEEKAASFSLTRADSGKVFEITAADVVASLPAVDANMKGVFFTFVVTTLSTTTGFSVSPSSSDQIRGKGMSAADDKDYINSAATDAVGDLLKIVCDGDAGWMVLEERGTWAREA